MIEELQDFGLNEREAKIYLQVLKDQGETASTLAKRTNMNRTTAYLELNNLINRGLVSYVIKDKKKVFQAVEPEKFIEILDSKKERMSKILPRLKGLHKSINPFKIEIYEGKEGVKTLYNDLLTNSKEVFVFGVTGYAWDVLKFEFPHFIKKVKKKGLRLKYLANKSAKKNLDKTPRNFIEIKYLPEKYKSEVTTIIYGDKIAIQSLVEGNIFVVVIKDALLSEGYRNYFQYMWELTK